MKLNLALLSLTCILLFASCNGKKEATVNNISPDKHVHITVSGTRPSALDAWKVNIAVKAYDFKEGKLEFEIYADDLSDANVKFDWNDERNCIISITQRDGEQRRFHLIADANHVQLAEIPKAN
jgi:hypothetical protein